MKDLPKDVAGVKRKGEITGSVYEKVLIPAVEKNWKIIKKIRFIYHIGAGFTGFDARAIFDDTVIEMKHLIAWERTAFVSDHEQYYSMVIFFGHLMPGKINVYNDNELSNAIKWITEN